jgi:hypothetical protein
LTELTAITVFTHENPDSPAPRGRFPAFGLRPSDPGPHRCLGQIEVPGHLPGRPVTSTAPLHDLALNSGVKDRRRARLLPFHGLHGSFFKTIASKIDDSRIRRSGR